MERKPFKHMFLLSIFSSFLLAGCAAGFIYLPSDSTTAPKTYYSPAFFSGTIPFEKGIDCRMSVVITRRVLRKLTPDDVLSAATLVLHFSNPNTRDFRIKIESLETGGQTFHVSQRPFMLKANRIFSTSEIALKAPTYERNFDVLLNYEIDGEKRQHTYFLKRETVQELNQAMNSF